MNCTEINNPELLVHYFRMDDEPTITRVLNCFRKEYYEYLLRFSYKKVFSKWTIPKYMEAELQMEAFNTSLSSFYLYIREKGFEQRGATVKTLFSAFYIRRLNGQAKILTNKLKKHLSSDAPEGAAAKALSVTDFQTEKEKREWEERRFALLDTAFSQLSERCSNLLLWRKLKGQSNEEIASQLTSLAADSVNNEVYKCFMRLKKIVDSLQKDDELWN